MVFLYLNSNGMGAGPDESLSNQLLVMFLEKLAASNERIDVVGCVNSGVFLTTKEGPALDSLVQLQEKGARIASCGTCLEHFGLTDALKIGEIGSMVNTVEIMMKADRIIRPC